MLAGVLHFVLYLGTLVPALGVAAVATLISGSIGMGLMAWLQSRYARVNAAVLFIALLFFGWLWGVAGLLRGASPIAIAKVDRDRVDALQRAGEMPGHRGRPAPEPPL